MLRTLPALLALALVAPSSAALAQGEAQLDAVTIHLFLARGDLRGVMRGL